VRCIAVYGVGGMGREVMALARAQYSDQNTNLVFVDDGVADGCDVLTFEEFLGRPEKDKAVTIAIANSAIREKLANRCAQEGVRALEVRASNMVVLDDVQIGEGAVLCAFTHITSTIRIGRHFHANYYAYVAHDCMIGDFVTFAPGAKCNGNVHIEDHAYIGSGAVIRQGTPDKPMRIGRGAVIGMGAVVTRDVPAGVTVIGNPARPMHR
jgi:sugar O-acyltransferase (sialic acid O-acetyltransferase NeuD family)